MKGVIEIEEIEAMKVFGKMEVFEESEVEAVEF